MKIFLFYTEGNVTSQFYWCNWFSIQRHWPFL